MWVGLDCFGCQKNAFNSPLCHCFSVQDILFQYPRQLSVDEGGGGGAVSLEQLVRLRGAFLTLSDVLATVTGYPSVSK